MSFARDTYVAAQPRVAAAAAEPARLNAYSLATPRVAASRRGRLATVSGDQEVEWIGASTS